MKEIVSSEWEVELGEKRVEREVEERKKREEERARLK